MEGPPAKRLKAEPAPLLPGWTEHTAPTGHKYYYNKATKKSTYTRPVQEVLAPPPASQALPEHQPISNGITYAAPADPQTPPAYSHGAPPQIASSPATYVPGQALPSQADYFRANGGRPSQPFHARGPPPMHASYRSPPRRQPDDRPKRKAVIPDCHPWILIYTRLGRRFVHNIETKESLWKFPPDVMKAVIAYDQQQLEAKYGTPGVRKPGAAGDQVKEESGVDAAPLQEDRPPTEEEKRALAAYEARRAASLEREKKEDAALLADLADRNQEERIWVPPAQTALAYDSSEYEEIEVTDTEGEDSDNEDGAAQQEAEDKPLEFDEEDIAYQLAAMGEAYGLDPEEYGDGDGGEGELDYSGDEADEEDDGEAGLPFSDEERYQVFADMLIEYDVSPYTPWESLVSDERPHAILHDEHFTVLQSSRARKEGFDRWARERAAQLKAQRQANMSKSDDARVVFLQFLEEKNKEVKKLYWVEFRRKHKREAGLKGNSKFGDREMEKCYREFAGKMKLAPERRVAEFKDALKEIKEESARKGESAEEAIARARADVRHWACDAADRASLFEGWVVEVAGLDDADGSGHGEQMSKEERAIQQRTREAETGRRRAEKDAKYARGMLRDNERELEMAMKVGNQGMRSQLVD